MRKILVSAGIVILMGMLAHREYGFLSPPKKSTATDSVAIQPKEYNPNADYSVNLNTVSEVETRIVLSDAKTSAAHEFGKIANVISGHTRPAIFKHGYLYVIRRFDSSGKSPDELWRYDKQLLGVKVASAPNMHFSISDSGNFAAVFSPGQVSIYRVVPEVASKSLFSLTLPGVEMSLLGWSKDNLWVSTTDGPGLTAALEINTQTSKLTNHNLRSFNIKVEYVFNPESELLAYSTLPDFKNYEEYEKYKQTDDKTELFVYDFKSKNKTLIATAVTSRFSPAWKQARVLEYNNPRSPGRVTTTIK